MEKRQRYTLGSNERLKSRKAIEQLFADGKSFSLFPFRVVYHKAAANPGGQPLQAAFSVSKRYFKKAVHRNRIKRLMREAYRMQKINLQNELQQKNQQLVIFLMYTGKDLPDHPLVMEKIAAVTRRFQKILHEATAADT